MTISRSWKIGLCLTAIFLAGIVTGVMVTAKVVQSVIARRTGMEKWAEIVMKNYQRRLKLTPEQTQKLKPVFDQAAAELGKVRDNTATEIWAIMRQANQEVSRELTPGQEKIFDQMRQEFRAKMRERFHALPSADGR